MESHEPSEKIILTISDYGDTTNSNEMTGDHQKDEFDDVLKLLLEDAFKDRCKDIGYLRDDKSFVSSTLSQFTRRYARRSELPEEHTSRVSEILFQIMKDVREKETLFTSKTYLKSLHKQCFNRGYDNLLKSKFQIEKEGIKGLCLAVVMREFLMNPPSGNELELTPSEITADVVRSNVRPTLAPDEVLLQEFLSICSDEFFSCSNLSKEDDEFSRLFRFYKVIRLLQQYYEPKSNRGLFLFVGILLEDVPDPIHRLYSSGGKPAVETVRRLDIIEKVTKVPRRIRRKSTAEEKKESLDADDNEMCSEGSGKETSEGVTPVSSPRKRKYDT
jgi:hypothetical protein